MKKILPLLILPVLVSNAAANAGPGPWANGAYYPGQLDGRYSANVYNNTQDRFDADEMDPPSGNSRYTNSFTVTPATTNPATTNTFLTTNVTISITNVDGIISTTSTTNITSTTVTNLATTNLAVTNLASSGAANVVSGVLGFAVRNGTPLTSSAGSTAGAAAGGASGQPSVAAGATGSSSGGTVDTIGFDPSANYFVVYVNGDVFAGKTAAGVNLNTKRVAGSLFNGTGGLTYQVVTNSGGLLSSNSGNVTILPTPTASAGGYFNAKIKNNKSPFVFKGAGAITVNSAATVATPSGTYPFDVDGIKSSEN